MAPRKPKSLPFEVPLGASGQAFYDALTADVEFAPERLRLVRDAAMTVDAIELLTRELQDLPLVQKGAGGGAIANVLLVERRQQVALLSRTIAALQIPEAPDGSGVMSRSEQARKAALTRWGRLA